MSLIANTDFDATFRERFYPLRKRLIRSAIILGATLSIFFTTSQFTHALEPIHEADRLIMAAEDAMVENDFRSAEQYLLRAEALGIDLPSDYDFLFGKLLEQKGENKKANEKLESYVNRDGNEGRYYREALSLITTIEKRLEITNDSPNQTPTSEIKWSNNNDAYLQAIQRQEKINNTEQALSAHINRLLNKQETTDRKIIAASRLATPSKHKIKTSSNGEIISINQYGGDLSSPFKEERFSVYGVNPYIRFVCPQSTASCWILHPVTEKRWLQLEENTETAMEVAKALSQLIRYMQKKS